MARDYDRIAAAYQRHLRDELDGKPLDRALLAMVADAARGRGPVGDLGCGPGHVSAHLAALGADVVGVDLSPRMVELASEAVPAGRFLVGDLRDLPLADGCLAAAVALYSIIHLPGPEDLRRACAEFHRVLAPGAEVLVAFHRGDETVHPGALWGHPVGLGFVFLPAERVTSALVEAGLEPRARIDRAPYEGAEHPSERTSLIARRPGHRIGAP